jgi:hypothetical protein
MDSAITTAWTANAATQASAIAGANAAIVTANTSLKSYVDDRDSAITSAWTANAASQQGLIATLQTQVYTNSNVATYLPTYAGNISAGNVNVSANVYATGNIYSAGSRILTAADLATITYTADYITNDPTSVTGLSTVAGTTNTYGTYNFGDVSDILVYGDYDTVANTGFYSVNDATGAPGHVEYIGFSNVSGFNRLNYNINYTANSGHTINFELYNYEYMHWDTFATTTGAGSWQTFTLGVIDDTPYIGTGANLGNVTTRINHVSSGNVQHRTWIDYVALEQSITGGQGPRGPTGSTGSTGATGPAWAGGYVANVTTFGSNLVANSATASTNTTTGALVVVGGAGISGTIYAGGIVANGVDLVANAATQASDIITANTSLKSYVDDRDSAITTAWTANAATQASAIAGANAAIITANTALKSYVDAQFTSLVGGAPVVLDTLYEIANSLGNNSSLSTTLLNSLSGANASIATLQTQVYSNVNTAAYLTGTVSIGNISITDGVFWANGSAYSSGSGSTYTVSTTAPSGPAIGDKWFNSTTDILYEFQDVGTGTFWIDVTSAVVVSDSATTSTVETLSPFLLMGG